MAVVYNGTKGAVDAITHTLAKELGSRKIRVNAINPGVVNTEGARAMGVIDGEFEASAIAQTPLGRVGLPEDIGPIAVFLASGDGRWVNGETILAAGGMRLRPSRHARASHAHDEKSGQSCSANEPSTPSE